MPKRTLQETIAAWRRLPPEERRRRHLESIPRHVADSMAMEGEPVDEEIIRRRLATRMAQRATSKQPPAS